MSHLAFGSLSLSLVPLLSFFKITRCEGTTNLWILGNTYSIKNLAKTESRIFFAQAYETTVQE
ncbi:hypothetical protein BU24DRAFT_423006 [Aaosphaeria arxii CBS 175.79]|uniref:Uncharacterized protein n=1 Tax=Aaosphaeria arxii CBS 175.79 TaxID=1450172 RepID=A0A6A5XTF3_9PLEO|nr:uncharacterized protein BU24DRAFT_423006 [Aaosphaeria arxii CBS 175.79]KAF2016625.1 hypothetical protein BU24DRAFT_423006 [Aaosphaeria arxii CBS 175.79]